MGYRTVLDSARENGIVTSQQYDHLEEFYSTFRHAITENNKKIADYEQIVIQYLEQVLLECQTPSPFEPYHKAVRKPFDYYQLGLDFFRPLIIFESSTIDHPERIKEIENHLEKGENVILFANHQIEPDPQVISLMLENEHPKLAQEIIMVAGHRVISDPLAIPFSKGRNLLCIFSKKHVENPPELKQQKLLHNQRTMHKMSELLTEGGKCIYVAPSGGRDRFDEATGKVEISPFDPASIEMFYLMAQHAKKPTHFYPLSLSTYDLLPPPKTVDRELGERRCAHSAPVHISFGKEIDMVNFPGSDTKDKKAKRAVRSNYIWELVKQLY